MKIHSTVFKNVLTILHCLNVIVPCAFCVSNCIYYILYYIFIRFLSIIIFNCNNSMLFMVILLYYFILSIDLILEKNRI
jgi:hypothetical protein